MSQHITVSKVIIRLTWTLSHGGSWSSSFHHMSHSSMPLATHQDMCTHSRHQNGKSCPFKNTAQYMQSMGRASTLVAKVVFSGSFSSWPAAIRGLTNLGWYHDWTYELNTIKHCQVSSLYTCSLFIFNRRTTILKTQYKHKKLKLIILLCRPTKRLQFQFFQCRRRHNTKITKTSMFLL